MYESVHYIHSGRFTSRGTWQHGQRVIDSYELILLLQGEAFITAGGTDYTLTPGDVLRLDPDLPHGGTRPSQAPVSFFWIHFRAGAPEELPPRFFRPESAAQAFLLCRQLLHYANTEGYPPECTDCLLRVLLMELTVQNRRAASPAGRLCAEVREWVRINGDLPLRVSDVAARFRYNEDYLNRVFRQEYPAGLKAYIDSVRMERIKNELANTDLPLQDIAARYGFSDYKYFLKYFRYHEGVSPTRYRRLFCNTHLNNH